MAMTSSYYFDTGRLISQLLNIPFCSHSPTSQPAETTFWDFISMKKETTFITMYVIYYLERSNRQRQ